MDLSGSFSGDELIPDSCLESEWIDEAEVFAILKQWEARGDRSNTTTKHREAAFGGSNNSGHILLNQSLGNGASIGISNQKLDALSTEQQLSESFTDCNKKQQLLDDIDSSKSYEKRLLNQNSVSSKFVDTGTFTRPKKRIEPSLLNSSTFSVESSPSVSSQHELTSEGGLPVVNLQIGGPVTPSALASSATGNRLLMQRSWLNDVSPPCSIMNSMEYSANEKITSSLITSGDFSSVGCLLNTSDVGNASYNGYNLYSVMEDTRRLENLCMDDESTLTKDCNISRTDLNAIESVSGVSTMQNSYESGGRAVNVTVSTKSSFEEDGSPTIVETAEGSAVEVVGNGSQNTTVTVVNAQDETFHLPAEFAEADLVSKTTIPGRMLANGSGTYDMRRPRNFNTYRKPRSSMNQTFEGLPQVDMNDADVDKTSINEQTFDGQVPTVAPSNKHTVMNSTFGIVSDEQVGGIANGHGTFVRNRTIKNDDVRLLNLTHDREDQAGAVMQPPPVVDVPFDRTFKRRPRNGTFTGGKEDELHMPLEISPLRLTNDMDLDDEEVEREHHTPNGTFSEQQNGNNSSLVQSTPFHGSFTRGKPGPDIPGISPIGPENPKRTSTSSMGRNIVRRSRNLEQDIRNATYEGRIELSDTVTGTGGSDGLADPLLDLETDDFDVQIRRLPAAAPSDISNFLDAEKRISLQHFEEFEKSILESELSGIDFDEMLNSLTADVRRSDEAGDKLRQSLDNIKKRHSRINLEKQHQDELKRKLHQQPAAVLETPSDNKLADSMISMKSMSSSSGSERLLNRRSRYNEDVQLPMSPQQQQQMNSTVTMPNGDSGEGCGGDSNDPVPTANEVETYDRKNRDRFKTIRLGRKRDDSLGAALPDVDQELSQQHLVNGLEEDSLNSSSGSNSAFSRMDHNAQRPTVPSNLPSMKTEVAGEEDDAVFKKPQQLSGLARPGESRLRSTISKPRFYGAAPLQGIGIQRKDLTLPLGNKSSSTDCLEQQQLQQLGKPQQPASRLATMSKLGGGSGGLIGTGRYSQFGLQNRQQQQHQSNALQQQQQQQSVGAPTLKSPMGTKSKSYHSLTFAQANNGTGYGGSSSNLSKLHGTSALQLKLKHNSSNTELKSNTSKRSTLQPQQTSSNLRAALGYQQGAGAAGAGIVGRASLPLVRPAATAAQPIAARTSLNNSSSAAAMANKSALNATITLSGAGVQMRAASGLAKTSKLGLVRPSSGYFSYNTHRKHPDSDNESINSLSSSSASSRGSLYRVDSQSIANTVQPQPFTSGTRTNSIEDVSGTSAGVSNGLLTKLNGTGAGMQTGPLMSRAAEPASRTTEGGSLKQPVATAGVKPSGLRPPSALRPPTVRSGLPRPTSYIRR
ncbi:uncharacterized protein LOC128723140 [Anopheles nili]|uniref:uncharacterized protein LOC128723140 n=1 Tax=Anopheles nili TaxID=185578 RepID=UPI00237B0882|nr:uncharacterized protein LOC128723140 [Anopheles nili]